MALTQIDERCALIVIDLQNGIVGLPTADPAAEIIARSAQLASAFRERGLPVVLVNVAGSAPGRTDVGPLNFSFTDDWVSLVPELGQQPSDHRVTKYRRGAFLGTDLHAYLQGQGVTQVVVVGIATSIGVESTARSAYDLGYHVVLVVDAMTDINADAHRHSIEKVFPRMAETTRTAELLARLQAR